MVSKAEITKDIAQTAIESGAKHAGRVATLIAGTVGGVAQDVAGIVFKPSLSGGAQRVGNIVTRIAGCVGDVAKEVGTFATDMFDIAEAGAKARADARAEAGMHQDEDAAGGSRKVD